MKKFYGILLCLALMAFKTSVQAQSPCPAVTAELIGPFPQTAQQNSYGVKVTLAAPYSQNVTVNGTIGDNGYMMDGWQVVIPAGNLTAQTGSDIYYINVDRTPTIEISNVSPCPPGATPTVGIENGVLKFGSLAEYEEYADNTLDRQTLIDLYLGSSSLTALAETDTMDTNNDDEYPEFLKMILNQDKIFAFSNYLMKIDLTNHRGLVIDSRITNAYQTLVTDDLNATGLMIFNEDVDNAIDVLEQIESGSLSPSNYQTAIETLDPEAPQPLPQGGPSSKFDLEMQTYRSCPGAHERKDKDDYPYIWYNSTDPWSLCPDLSILVAQDNKVVYQRAIVYFSLQSKIRSVFGCSSTNWIGAPFFYHADLSINGIAKFSKRCEPEQTLVNLTAGRMRQGGAVKTWRPYEGGRSLSKYDFSVTFGARLLGNTGSYSASRGYHIVYGY